MRAYTAVLVELREWCRWREGWRSDPADSAALLATLLGSINFVTLFGLTELITDRRLEFFGVGARSKLVLLVVFLVLYFVNRAVLRRQPPIGPDALRPVSRRTQMYVYVSVFAFVVGLLLAAST
jgi:hypothetical protein